MKGQFRVFSQGQIVVSHITGQWSDQTALKYEYAMHELVASLAEREFSHLLFFEDWELSTPDVQPIVERMVDWLVSQGMCCAAEVFSHDPLKEFLLNKVVEEVKGNVFVRRFSCESDALRWLAEQGFASGKASLIAQ
ncbi:MAG: hypothetical protein ACJA13_001068 [Paraglaciecola sp.]|jgi:hypothetical protein